MIVPEEGFLLPSSRVPGEMVLDEIDTCINGHTHGTRSRNYLTNNPDVCKNVI